MRVFVFCLLPLFLAGSVGFAGCVDPIHMATSTVLLDFKGSGTVVRIENYGKVDCVYVLTCAHVVSANSLPFVIFSKYEPMYGLRMGIEVTIGRVLCRDWGTDLAVVETFVPKGTVRAARIGRDLPRLGDPLWCSSYPLGTYILTTGICAGQDGTEILSSSIVFGGSSGGGVYNKRGELVGVVRKSTIHHVAGFVPVGRSAIEDMLKRRGDIGR